MPLRRLLVLSVLLVARLAAEPSSGAPQDHLPPHIRQLTHFGERADWSADGKKILFLTKTFGDALEVDVATGAITNLTSHYPHYGYTRALYLANGDVLLAGPTEYDLKNAGRARNECYLFVLNPRTRTPPVALGARCNEGPAVSRRRLHVAWSEWQPPTDGGDLSTFSLYEADVAYTDGVPALANRRRIVDSTQVPFRCTLETQNFRPPGETELTAAAYFKGGRLCDVVGIELATGKTTNYTDSPEIYDEPEGMFPDGRRTLVECDAQNRGGPGNVDLWSLTLDSSRAYRRLTHFSDYAGYKASNGVISDDGRYLAFQMARTGEAAGVGHGIFVYDLQADTGR